MYSKKYVEKTASKSRHFDETTSKNVFALISACYQPIPEELIPRS
jgi:hypothetical protein